MRHLSFQFVACALLFCASLSGFSDQMERVLEDLSSRPFKGSVLIFQDGAILAQTHRGVPETLRSQFAIGSISKQFTSALLLHLVDEGKISLNDPLDEDAYPNVCVLHLLSHTAGLGSDGSQEPGEAFRYSPTLGYFLASQLITTATGQEYADVLGAFLKKAGLNNTTLAKTKDLNQLQSQYPTLAQGTSVFSGQFERAQELDEGVDLPDGSWTHPGGGMLSTPEDLMRWLIALHEPPRLLSDVAYYEMTTPKAMRMGHRYGDIGYGLGLQIYNADGLQELSHSGYINGYTSTLLYYPEAKLGVIILENLSWDLSDPEKVFQPHDQIRKRVREHLLARTWATRSNQRLPPF